MKVRRRIFYGWYTVVISFAIMSAAYAVYYSWPVFYVAILDEFGWSRAETALIWSIGTMLYGLASPVAGALFDRLGPKKLFILAAILIAIGAMGSSRATEIWHFVIFLGVLVAFGTIFAGFVPQMAMISNWFVKKRATAVGFAAAGTREAFILTPLILVIILAIGWRNTYLVLAAATAIIIIPLSLFLRARPQDMGLLPDGETMVEEEKEAGRSKADTLIVDEKWASTEWTLLKAVKEYRFWALFVVLVGSGLALTPILMHQVAFITDAGFTAMFAATLLTIYAITCIVGRFSGFISDMIGRELSLTVACLGTILAIILLFFVKDTSAAWMLYVYAVLFGFFGGLQTPAYSAAAADLFQGKNFGTILGTINVAYGISAGFGTWLFGYIFDVTGSYYLGFVVVIAGLVMKIIAVWVAAPRKVRRVAGRAPKTI